jgi:dolichyl-phosphate beta-glucosyltransferase
MMLPLIYVLPVHNDETVLEGNVRRLVTYLERFDDASVYLVENGSRDASWEVAQRLATPAKGASDGDGSDRVRVPVRAFREPEAGLGYAYHRGLVETLAAFGPARAWAVLTASDLPFGLSDLEAALGHLHRPKCRILIGSKAHPDSQADTGTKRRVMSFAYRVARRAVLGMRVSDSQGSVFLRLDLASELLPKVRARDFFYSTELCHYAERAGETIEELPVVLEAEQRASTVKPLKHGVDMARQLIKLRRRG